MPEQISQLLDSHTFVKISLILHDECPDIRSLSVKSIKRFCQTYGIKKRRFLSEDELEDEFMMKQLHRPYNRYYVLLNRCASCFLLPESVHKYV